MSETNHKVVVFRFRMTRDGREISPQHMWGTPEAIAGLPGCELVDGTGRQVHRKLLDQGFYFEQAGGAYIDIEEEIRR